MLAVKALAFDTGGTILDWHSGLVAALKECGARRGVEHSWYEFANEYRRRALRRMVGAVDPAFNKDDVHREVLDGLLVERRIDAFSPEDRQSITRLPKAGTNLMPRSRRRWWRCAFQWGA